MGKLRYPDISEIPACYCYLLDGFIMAITQSEYEE